MTPPAGLIRLHLRQLDPVLRGKRLEDINMDVLWSFIRERRERDEVSNSTVIARWKSYDMVLRYAHLAPEHLASVARRIERPLEIVESNPTISLR